MIAWLKCLLTGHDLTFVRNLYGDEIINRGWNRSVWRCRKCAAIRDKKKLHSPGDDCFLEKM